MKKYQGAFLIWTPCKHRWCQKCKQICFAFMFAGGTIGRAKSSTPDTTAGWSLQ